MSPDEEIKRDKQKILDYVRTHPGQDALQVALALEFDVAYMYVLVAALISKKQLTIIHGTLTVKDK